MPDDSSEANALFCDRAVLVAALSHYEGADPVQHPAAWRLTVRLRGIPSRSDARLAPRGSKVTPERLPPAA
jgi:hypothetical protein